MSALFVLLSVLQSFGISLGVGCSTVAIVFYLTSKVDDPYAEARRHFSRIVYTLLRVAMGVILVTTAISGYVLLSSIGPEYLSTYTFAFWTYVFMLILNAILMTLHLMPRFIGPGLQAATWYALGITVSLPSVLIFEMSYIEFFSWYIGWIGFIVVVINLYIAHQKGDL